MDEKSEQSTAIGEDQPLDLSELEGMSLGPAWSDSDHTSSTTKLNKKAEGKPSRDAQATASRRDRRPRQSPLVEKRPESRPPFKPSVDVIFYPEDTAFKTLVKALRASNKTYELFDIARLILAKSDRYVAMIRPVSLEEKKPRQLYIALADGCPFESGEKAFEHCFENYADQYFKIETVTIDPPKGKFVMVNRCSITGELLGPPNYHRYQEFIEDHHASRLPDMPYESFVSKIEAVKDPEIIEEWLQKMTSQTRYILKDADNANDPLTFDNSKTARKYLYENKFSKLVKSASTVRVSGKLISAMPAQCAIRRSTEFHLESQRRFPLETANHLRGRLRRLKINVYKRGSRGISYICAVKRRFRLEGQNFADSVQSLIEFIEKNPRTKVSHLEESFLGIKKTDKVAENQSTNENVDAVSGELSLEVKEKLHLMRQDLHWLITEGYFVEYEDGSLYAPPPRPKVRHSSTTKADNGIKPEAIGRSDKVASGENAESVSESIPESTSTPVPGSEEDVSTESLVKEENTGAMGNPEKASDDEGKVSVISANVENEITALKEEGENVDKTN